MNISKINNIFFYVNKTNNTVEIQLNDRKLNTVVHYASVLDRDVVKFHVSENVSSKTVAAKATARIKDIQNFHPEAHMFYHGKVENLNIDITYDNRTGRTGVIIREVIEGKRDVVVFGTFAAAGTARTGSLRRSNVSLLPLKAALACQEEIVRKMVGKWDAAVLANKALTQTDLKQFVRNLLRNEEAAAIIHKEMKVRQDDVKDEALRIMLDCDMDIVEAMDIVASEEFNEAQEQAVIEAADISNEEIKPTLMQEMLSDNAVIELPTVVLPIEAPVVTEEVENDPLAVQAQRFGITKELLIDKLSDMKHANDNYFFQEALKETRMSMFETWSDYRDSVMALSRSKASFAYGDVASRIDFEF
ncbi:hypothetical protein KGV31_002140 [Vibrio parahaemolyticus]|nr:hypothetical protein [Vibrio parahaemolyticus]EHU0344284.1 hypothetical protein [Vibrio parahaemolyticus]EHU0354318.1 hypothetical protein [Vibrio parahaemolyticus]